MRSLCSVAIAAAICLFLSLSVSEGVSQNLSIEVSPSQLNFGGEESIPIILDEKAHFERTLAIYDTSGLGANNVTLVSSALYDLNSSNFVSEENVHFSLNQFTLRPRELRQITVTLELINPRAGTYRGYIFVLVNGDRTLNVETVLALRSNTFTRYLVSFIVILIVTVAFWILLRQEDHRKRDLLVSLFLILFGLILIVTFPPFGLEFNSLLIAALLSPLITYIISMLKVKRDFLKHKDEVSHDYRRRMIERESSLIGSLIGELTTHAAAFAASDWPEPCEILENVWNNSEKVGLISDIHTNLLSKYYYCIPFYNHCIKTLRELMTKSSGKLGSTELASLELSFVELKQIFLETETLLYHTLIYDLGLLQQRFLARPDVLFPIHMSILLRQKLQKFGILKEDEKITGRVYSDTNAAKFTLKIVKSFNASYARLETSLHSLVKNVDAKIS